MDIEDRIYGLGEASVILKTKPDGLRSAAKRGLLKIVDKCIEGSEIKRYSGRPTKKGWYDFQDLLSYISPHIPDPEYFDIKKFNDWIVKKLHKDGRTYLIHNFGEGYQLQLQVALRLYTDMTLPN